MHTTLRAYMTSPNMSLIVHPDANCSAARNDPVSLSWPVVDEWGPWTDFNIENIDNLLGNLLDTSFEVADPPPPLESSRLLHHESQFDFVLVRQNNVIVNEALRVACRHLGLDQVEWTRGGNNSGERTFPDWSGTLVSGSEEETNLIPGDTKFTRNCLRPERIGKEDKFPDSDGLAPSSAPNSETDLARSCLQQVNSYAAACGVRYFYVITNKELFLCRRTMDSPLESSIAAQRTKRVKISGLDSTRKRPQAFPLSSPQVPLSSPQVPPSSPQAFPPSSPPAIIRRSQRLAVSLNEVAADPPSVSRKLCVSEYRC